MHRPATTPFPPPADLPSWRRRAAWLAGMGLLGLVAATFLPASEESPSLTVPPGASTPTDTLITTLESRLARQPDDLVGWLMLARTRHALGQWSAAGAAYAHAAALAPGDAQILADRADALAMAQGRSALGEPARLIAEALAIDPDHPKALALAATAALERRAPGEALGYWRRARAVAPVPSALAASLDAEIAAAEGALAGGGPRP